MEFPFNVVLCEADRSFTSPAHPNPAESLASDGCKTEDGTPPSLVYDGLLNSWRVPFRTTIWAFWQPWWEGIVRPNMAERSWKNLVLKLKN